MGDAVKRTLRRLGLVLLCAAMLSSAASADPISAGSLMSDVTHYAQLGRAGHWTGSAAERRTLYWLARSLRAARLATGVDGARFYAFAPRRWSLRIGGSAIGPTVPFFYSGSTGRRPRNAPLVYVGNGTPAELADVQLQGKIAVVDVPYLENFLDPTFTGEGPAPGAFTSIEKAGAVGAVAVTEGPQNLPVNQDVNGSLGMQKLPTLFVGKRSGQGVIAAAKQGRSASLLLDAQPRWECSQNVWAVLPGADSSRFVVIETPTSAYDQAASERGAGDAILLALARHYAAVPRFQRPETLVFLAPSGHELGPGGPGILLLSQHPQWFGSRVDAYIGLGASIAAVQEQEQPDGSVRRYPFGDLSRDLYVSENPLLEPVAQAAFAPAQPLGSIPPAAFDPGDQQVAYQDGVPIVAISGASYWFHTAGDTPAGVDPALLGASAQAFRDTIDQIAALSPGTLRAANALPAGVAAHRGQVAIGPYGPRPAPRCGRLRG